MTTTHSSARSHVPALRLVKTRITIPSASSPVPRPVGDSCTAPADAVVALRHLIGDDATECVMAVLLNTRNKIVGYHEVARGTVNACRLTLRDVLIPALLANAPALILGHNHPSGDPTPSQADRRLTTEVRSGCRLLGLTLLDHIVVTPTAHYSFQTSEGWSDLA